MGHMKFGMLCAVALLSSACGGDDDRDEFESARSRWQGRHATTYAFV